tara:strand:- start:374 stop:1069 length:696 start_codon:yes stop_codon:yes gene_type:complete
MKRPAISALLIPAIVLVSSGILLATAAGPTHKLSRSKALPKGLAPKVAELIDPAGYQISGPKGAVCTIWLVKDVPIRGKFKPSLSVKYPFTAGQLVGVLQVNGKDGYTDFRGQELKAGVYTLRYGQQPEDGNHVGTSDLADFLLALPAKMDVDPKPIFGFDELSMRSAKSAGATHPAIFSMLPSEKPIKVASVTHDDDHDFWILNVQAAAKTKTKAAKVNLRFIAIGRTPE